MFHIIAIFLWILSLSLFIMYDSCDYTKFLLQNTLEGSKPLTQLRSFDNPAEKEIVHPPVRSKSVLSGFFAKQKTPNRRTRT